MPWFWLSLSLICAIVIASEQIEAGDLESDGSEFDLDSPTYLQFNPWADVRISWTSISLSVQCRKQYLNFQVCEDGADVSESGAWDRLISDAIIISGYFY